MPSDKCGERSVLLFLAVHTCPRLGLPHLRHLFFDSFPDFLILRALSSRIHLFRIDERVRPGSFCVMRFHFGPMSLTRLMMVVSSSIVHAFMFGRRPPFFFLTGLDVNGDCRGGDDDDANIANFETSSTFEDANESNREVVLCLGTL